MTSRSGNLDDHSYGTLGPAISCHCLTQRPCGPTGNPELRRQLQRVLKPVSPGTIKAQLNKAFDALQKEHRPYFRYTVNLPIFVGTEKEGFTPARLINVSAEGMAALVRRSAQLEGAVSLRFDLPSIDPIASPRKARRRDRVERCRGPHGNQAVAHARRGPAEVYGMAGRPALPT